MVNKLVWHSSRCQISCSECQNLILPSIFQTLNFDSISVVDSLLIVAGSVFVPCFVVHLYMRGSRGGGAADSDPPP